MILSICRGTVLKMGLTLEKRGGQRKAWVKERPDHTPLAVACPDI